MRRKQLPGREQDWTQFLSPGHSAGGTAYDGSDIDSCVCISCAEKSITEALDWEAERWLDTCPRCKRKVADLTDAGVCNVCHMDTKFPNPNSQ